MIAAAVSNSSVLRSVEPAVEVLEGGGAPTDFPLTLIGAGLQGGWRPDPGQVTTVGSALTQVNDLSTLGRHATQPGLSSARPTLASNWRNGRPAISCDGGDRLQIASTLLTTDNWTIATVQQAASIASARCIFGVGGISGHVALLLNDSASNSRDVRVKGVGVTSDGAATTAPESWVLSRDNGVLHLYVNGPEVSLTAPLIALAAASGNSVIGALADTGTFHFSGFIAEVFAFQLVFSAGQRAAYFSYANSRYAIF